MHETTPSTATNAWRPWILGMSMAIIGVWWQYGSLHLIERFVTNFPAVPDVVMDRLPRVEFDWLGEALFFGLILLFAVPHFRYRWRDTPRALFALGLFYFIRGWYMFLFPIGAPVGALPPGDRLNLWGYATHAFFPGGHIGVLATLALLTSTPWRRTVLWFGIAVFGLGTLLAKNHYTMDSLTGVILAYVIVVWMERRGLFFGVAGPGKGQTTRRCLEGVEVGSNPHD